MKPSSATDSVNIGILLQRVLSSLASNRCYACRWTMRHGGGCEPFNCSMRYSEYGTVAMAEKDGWLKRTEEMADVLRCFTSANSPFVRSEIAGWTEGDFLDQALDNATGTILSPYAAGKIRERAKELRAKAPRSAIASHQSVWEVENKTTRILFSTKESAQSFINTFPASVAGGMQLRQVGVV